VEFCQYLIAADGNMVYSFYSQVKPDLRELQGKPGPMPR
jgi:hypothetical protein